MLIRIHLFSHKYRQYDFSQVHRNPSRACWQNDVVLSQAYEGPIILCDKWYLHIKHAIQFYPSGVPILPFFYYLFIYFMDKASYPRKKKPFEKWSMLARGMNYSLIHIIKGNGLFPKTNASHKNRCN